MRIVSRFSTDRDLVSAANDDRASLNSAHHPLATATLMKKLDAHDFGWAGRPVAAARQSATIEANAQRAFELYGALLEPVEAGMG
jgi:hypothetical protein